MLLLDDINLLFRDRNKFQLSEYLNKIVSQVNTLQFQSEETITSVCDYLKTELETYAKIHSPIYQNHQGIITKNDLLDKDRWYVPDYNAATASTGGSTTGERFHYLRWSDTFQEIERDQHYKAILKEFGFDKPVTILYLMLDLTDDRESNDLIKTFNTSNILISHGQQQIATVHEVRRNRIYYHNYYLFYEQILQFITKNKIDIILAPGHVLASLVWNIKRLKHTTPICKLLSNTGDKANIADFDYLKNNGLIDNWCDHMRCWDGGVTFFTCQYNVYHLLDGLAWAHTDNDERLISTDFFSLPSPFVNYWNGDYCSIGNEYKQCQCGRMYREFAINRTRSVAVSSITNSSIRSTLSQTDFLNGIVKRANASGQFIRLFTKRSLTSQERLTTRELLPNFELNFVVEEDNG